MPLVIGVDPGVQTGLAVKTLALRPEWVAIETLPVHAALAYLLRLAMRNELFVVVEDARKRRWFDDGGSTSDKIGKRMGAGSIKRDSKIWEDFCTDLGLPLALRPPAAGVTKIKRDYFARLTGYTKPTSNHARDAAMLIHGITKLNYKLLWNNP